MYNIVSSLAPSFLIGSSSFLQVTRTAIKYWMSSKFGKIGQWFVELAAIERLEKSYNERNLHGSSSFLPVTRKTTKAWTALNLDQIPSPTTE